MYPLPKAILLDLDDTIVALSDSADPCWRLVCERFFGQVEGLTPMRVKLRAQRPRVVAKMGGPTTS